LIPSLHLDEEKKKKKKKLTIFIPSTRLALNSVLTWREKGAGRR